MAKDRSVLEEHAKRRADEAQSNRDDYISPADYERGLLPAALKKSKERTDKLPPPKAERPTVKDPEAKKTSRDLLKSMDGMAKDARKSKADLEAEREKAAKAQERQVRSAMREQ